MRVYLDNCCFNRPFDDQSQIRVRLETEAKLDVQSRIERSEYELAWSYILDYENAANPFDERRLAIGDWKAHASVDVEESSEVLAKARELASRGVRPKDALHVACAIEAGCSHFLTTDGALIRRLQACESIRVTNPVSFVAGEE